MIFWWPAYRSQGHLWSRWQWTNSWRSREENMFQQKWNQSQQSHLTPGTSFLPGLMALVETLLVPRWKTLRTEAWGSCLLCITWVLRIMFFKSGVTSHTLGALFSWSKLSVSCCLNCVPKLNKASVRSWHWNIWVDAPVGESFASTFILRGNSSFTFSPGCWKLWMLVWSIVSMDLVLQRWSWDE